MPYTRPMKTQELKIFAICDRSLTPVHIAAIEEKVAQGSVLTMEASTVSDPTEFSRVLLDGVQVAYTEGY
jgi:hypothetical protein